MRNIKFIHFLEFLNVSGANNIGNPLEAALLVFVMKLSNHHGFDSKFKFRKIPKLDPLVVKMISFGLGIYQ